MDSVASDAITDGNDDKKIDMIYIDRDERIAVVAQCYHSKIMKASAPSNKASDLNTAVGWLLQSPIEKVPARIRPSAEQLRDAINQGILSEIHIWYVHNLHESANVASELSVVEKTAHAALRLHFPKSEIRVASEEIGSERLGLWYNESLTPILVNDQFTVMVPSGFDMHSANWEAYVTALPASFLHKIYKNYGANLFSANVRDYLGSRKSDQNINNGIKVTAEENPENFWVFNNGLTLLVNN